MPTRTGTQSIDRASQLLVHVVEEDDAPTVGELAELAGLPKSTTSRLVGALERQGLVQRDPGRAARSARGRCSCATRSRETTRPDLVELAGEALERLARRERRDGQPRRRDLDRRRDARPARQPPHPRLDQLGRPSRAAPRLGRSARSSSPRARCRSRPGRSSRSGRCTITDVGGAAPRSRARRARRGYAVAVDELEAGLWAVAAPVRDAGGSVVAALSISGPTVRLHDGLLDELGRLVRDEASTLSVRIGYDDVKRGVA